MPPKKTTRTTKNELNTIWSERLDYFESRLPALVQTIREFVEIESPSDNKLAADRMGTLLAARFEAAGGHASVHRAENYGDNIQIDFPGRDKTKPVLLLGHFDTVYPLGTLANMPCHQTGNRLHGPGVLDMKSGVALMLYAIEALKSWHGALPRPVTVFLVSDEEVMRLLLPDLAPEMVHRVLKRSAYSEDDEEEAELLATLIVERSGGLLAPTARMPVRSDDPLGRLESILENGDGDGHA